MWPTQSLDLRPLSAVIMQPSLQIYSRTLKLMHRLYYSIEAVMPFARMGFNAIWSRCYSFSATGASTQANKLTGAEYSQYSVEKGEIFTLWSKMLLYQQKSKTFWSMSQNWKLEPDPCGLLGDDADTNIRD